MRGRYEVIYYHKETGERYQEGFELVYPAKKRARDLKSFGYFPVVVYDIHKQEWVDIAKI